MVGRMNMLSRHCARLAVVAAGLLVSATSAEAMQPQLCTKHGDLVAQLGEKYGETVSAFGFDGGGNLVQVFSSENGTWTIAISIPGGPTCVIAAGEDWQQEKTPLPKAEVAS